MIKQYKIEIVIFATKKPNINDILSSSEGFYDSEYNGIVESIKIKEMECNINENKKRVRK